MVGPHRVEHDEDHVRLGVPPAGEAEEGNHHQESACGAVLTGAAMESGPLPYYDTPSEGMQAGVSPSRRTAWIAWVAGAVPVVVAALFIGYTSIFSHYLWYDDEGYVMISVHGYLRGHPLFREVYTQYGPFFFFTRRAIYALLGVPVSHDANRLIALGEWLAAAGLCGVVAGRLTRSAWMGLLAGSLAFVHLEAFVKEPGHPQQLCMLLVATALVLWTLGRRSVGLVGIGVVCAALATTKVNIAAYLAPAILLALLLAGARQRLGREALGLVAALVVGLPIVVMYAGLELPSARAYAAIVTGAVAAALVAGHDPARPRVLSWADLLRFAVPVPLVVLAVLGATRLQGTTWWDLAEGLVLEPLRFAVVFKAVPMPLGQEGLLAGAAGLATSLVTLGPPRWRASLGWPLPSFRCETIACSWRGRTRCGSGPMTNDAGHYVGTELELFARALHWKSYWSRSIGRWVRGDVLEVGAGLGSNTLLLQNPTVTS
jgi:4-amino-4-deoxy-L-arabinose transferase-like glycosyltransferase